MTRNFLQKSNKQKIRKLMVKNYYEKCPLFLEKNVKAFRVKNK